MSPRNAQTALVRPIRRGSRAFTLIELLTVIAIIALLIGLLVPSLSRARDSAKNVKTKVTFKRIAEGLEAFRAENPDEVRGESYPSSRIADDPTEEGDYIRGREDLCGAQWLVRYLLGKKLDGYVAERSAPRAFFDPAPPKGWEQKGWYDNPGDPTWPANGPNGPLPRAGPYLPTDEVKLKAPKDLRGSPVPPADTNPQFNNPVMVDPYEMPICYYAADARLASQPNTSITEYMGHFFDRSEGIYRYSDNALFTGVGFIEAWDKFYPPWDFGNGRQTLTYGPAAWYRNWPRLRAEIGNYPHSFPYYIMNKEAFEATGGAGKGTVLPYRRDSFLLISPGKDGLFGTGDDITNF